MGLSLPKNGPSISHLQYAEDTLFVGEWSEDNALNLLRILRCFHLSSGLKVNLSKTTLTGIGVPSQEVSRVASLLNCATANLPFHYLGLLRQ